MAIKKTYLKPSEDNQKESETMQALHSLYSVLYYSLITVLHCSLITVLNFHFLGILFVHFYWKIQIDKILGGVFASCVF